MWFKNSGSAPINSICVLHVSDNSKLRLLVHNSTKVFSLQAIMLLPTLLTTVQSRAFSFVIPNSPTVSPDKLNISSITPSDLGPIWPSKIRLHKISSRTAPPAFSKLISVSSIGVSAGNCARIATPLANHSSSANAGAATTAKDAHAAVRASITMYIFVIFTSPFPHPRRGVRLFGRLVDRPPGTRPRSEGEGGPLVGWAFVAH